MTDRNEIILYQPDEAVKLEVRLSEETVWLNRNQMATLFGRDVKTIGKHIANALAEELSVFPVVAKFATTANDGKTYKGKWGFARHIQKTFSFSKPIFIPLSCSAF